jgi:hypothetical protein
MEKFVQKPVRSSIKILLIVLAIWFLLSLIANAIGIANIYWQAEKAKVTAAPRVTSKVYETENIIAKVAFFHEKCTNVVKDLHVFENNYERYLADKETARTTTGLEARSASEALSNDQSDYTAALNVAQEDAANYNAASDNPTIKQFRTIFSQHGLPEHIELPAGTTAAYKFKIYCH